ncbi:hypothetical protein GBZ86_11490 [Clostridium tarantellae]|uniref:Uncharacterized protein n=2 Tax=Clostridium tarantellae TaxID=39493 RepID=A0A6I1MN37_9CLOT|nr:hypothetical protein [Clostridium tarantellae]
MIPLLVNINEIDVPIIFIKDFKESIEVIKDDVLVSIKSSTIGDKKCDMFLLMIKFGDGYNNIYDIWFNYAFQWHMDFLNRLLDCDRILLDFRDENNDRIKTIQINNTISEYIEEYIEVCEKDVLIKGQRENNIISIEKRKNYEKWIDEDVYNLMDKVYDDFSTIEELWENF